MKLLFQTIYIPVVVISGLQHTPLDGSASKTNCMHGSAIIISSFAQAASVQPLECPHAFKKTHATHAYEPECFGGRIGCKYDEQANKKF